MGGCPCTDETRWRLGSAFVGAAAQQRGMDDSVAVRMKYSLYSRPNTHRASPAHIQQLDSSQAAKQQQQQRLTWYSRHFGVPLPPLIIVSFSSLTWLLIPLLSSSPLTSLRHVLACCLVPDCSQPNQIPTLLSSLQINLGL